MSSCKRRTDLSLRLTPRLAVWVTCYRRYSSIWTKSLLLDKPSCAPNFLKSICPFCRPHIHVNNKSPFSERSIVFVRIRVDRNPHRTLKTPLPHKRVVGRGWVKRHWWFSKGLAKQAKNTVSWLFLFSFSNVRNICFKSKICVHVITMFLLWFNYTFLFSRGSLLGQKKG